MTKFPELFAALAAEFPREEVKRREVKEKGGRTAVLHYITARTVMNHLDQVLGPENWWDHYRPHGNGICCELTVRLPDGSTVTKEGVGGITEMRDPSDTDKTGESDSLKRAAAKLGVGRYLYRDGVPDYTPAREPGPGPGPGPKPGTDGRTRALPWPKLLDWALARWHGFDPMPEDPIPADSDHRDKPREQIAREHRIAQHLAEVAVQDEKIPRSAVCKPAEAGQPPAKDPPRVWAQVKRLYATDPQWVKAALKLYLQEKQAEAEAIVPQPSAN